VPAFAHLSTILGSDRERLSKRHGATSIANFRDMGVLPEALMNYLALLGWAPTGGSREIFSKEELVKEFSLDRVTPSPAIFDMEKLYWLNRHYVKNAQAERIRKLAEPYFVQALRKAAGEKSAGAANISWNPSPEVSIWLGKITDFLAPSVDRLDQLPKRASAIFHYDARAALSAPDNAEVLAWSKTIAVLDAFAKHILEDESAKGGQLTADRFKAIVNEVKSQTGAKGKELFHPIRIVITGSHSGPDFDKLIPIIEEGSRLDLPQHVLNVRERVAEFQKARTATA
jgi:glutamyl-tRNA synthetase/nondiscriminating glutamyl-tRNA synthetase